MAKKLIDDRKNESFVDKAWKDYQKSQKKNSGKKKSTGTKKAVKRK